MLTESAIEAFAIKLLERLGYGCIHASDGNGAKGSRRVGQHNHEDFAG